jgi:FkbM family methyltransferase
MLFDRFFSDNMAAGLKRLRNHVNIGTVLDVGASNGCWTKMCAKVFPQAKYVLFEPQPCHKKKLARFASSTNAAVVAKAVGATEGTTYFEASDPFGGVLADQPEGNIEVPLTTIDSTVTHLQLSGPYLLKLDTHGVEKEILEGASQTLPHCEALIIEVYNHRIGKNTLLFWELCGYLHERGFRPVDLVDVMHRKRDRSLWQMDLFFVRNSWTGFESVSFD